MTEENKIQEVESMIKFTQNKTMIEVWNAAIEAAAEVINQCSAEGPYNAIGGARRIRELKK